MDLFSIFIYLVLTLIIYLILTIIRLQKAYCEWTEFTHGTYTTTCGYQFHFINQTIQDNDYIYCPACGKKIKNGGCGYKFKKQSNNSFSFFQVSNITQKNSDKEL